MSAPGQLRVSQALQQAQAAAPGTALDRVDAHLLLAHVLQQNRAWLIAHDDAWLTPAQQQAYAQLCAQRATGVPVAYLLGEREFHGLRLQVSPAVLVPRPETETLVDWALALLPPAAQAQVLDLGTGSGAIALALAAARPQACVHASDASAAALAVAQANAQRLGLNVRWHLGDWWQALAAPAQMATPAPGGPRPPPLPPTRFDLVLSNPPYIAGDDPHLHALRHEPLGALTPGGDGLDALRRIIAGAAAHLRPGGWLLLEHGYDQADAVAALLREAGLHRLSQRHDLAGHVRCSGATAAPQG